MKPLVQFILLVHHSLAMIILEKPSQIFTYPIQSDVVLPRDRWGQSSESPELRCRQSVLHRLAESTLRMFFPERHVLVSTLMTTPAAFTTTYIALPRILS